MANAAKLLHDLFEQWNRPGSYVVGARDDPSLAVHRRAVKYLDEIELSLDLLEAKDVYTAVYRKYFPRWVEIVFNYGQSWTSSTAGIEEVARDHLINFASQTRDLAIPIDSSKLKLQEAYLEAVEFALKSDSTLPPFVKVQVQHVVDNLREAIQQIDTIGDFEFQQLIDRLFAVLSSVEMRSDDPSVWDGWKDHFVWPFAYDVFKFSAGYGVAQLANAGVFGQIAALASGG